jgi:hypothetical protein
MNNRLLTIRNDGQEIVETSYWDSAQCKSGYCYLSWNAGAGRLLLPDALAAALTDMRAASCVIVSRGRWREQGNRDALELLFEDGTDSPYCVHLVAEQTDRLLPDTDQGGGFVIIVWTRDGAQLRLPGKYRSVASIPCLDPWQAH